jgi:hypothetical protein
LSGPLVGKPILVNFQVTTDALRTGNTKLQGLSADVDVAEGYAGSYLHVERSSSGIFQNAVNVNDNARAALDRLFADLKKVLHESGLELRAAAKLYDDTDHGVLVRMDQGYEQVRLAPGDGYAGNASTPQDEVPTDPGDYQPPEGVPDDEPALTPGGGGGAW